MIWRLIPYATGKPAINMAIDEAIFHCYLKGLVPPTLRFYGWDPPTLSIGYFQDLEHEVNLVNLAAKGFGLVRRSTGGRAVLHHRELTYAVIAGTKHGLPDGLMQSYFYIAQALVAAFKHFGVTAELHHPITSKKLATGACFESPSWYELKVINRKLVGSAQLRRDHSFLQHGSILLEFSAADLGSVLKLPEGDNFERLVDRLNQKVISFYDLGISVHPAELAQKITAGFRELYHHEFSLGSLTEVEQQLVNELVVAKYANPDWNYARRRSGNK
jgi:lipoate-protein ligase A